MPYGDSDDDWLKIDIIRGTKSARESLSNDQVVGCIYITEKENINLKDKTNREGLIDDGKALDDFINIIQLILRYIRKGAYARYLVSKKKSKEMKMIQEGKPLGLIEEELKKIDKEKDQKTYNILNKIKTSYRRESAFLTDKLKITEDLAGVGLSIETASHDLNLFMKKTKDDMLNLIKNLEKNKKINYEELVEKLTIINGNISRDLVEDLWRAKREKGEKKGKRFGYANAQRVQYDYVEGITRVSQYIVRNLTQKRKWTCSQNLTRPESRTNDYKYTKRKIEKIVRGGLDKKFWEKQYPDWEIRDVINGYEAVYNEITGWSIYLKLRRKE